MVKERHTAGSDDGNYADNDPYTPTITLPPVPLTVTGDDDLTEVRLLPATPPDSTAKEGDPSNTAKFRITLDTPTGVG